MLELKNIKKDYTSGDTVVEALKGVTLSFRKSEFVSVLGPSGCGKTTLLNLIGGLDSYTSGDLVINGRSTKSFKDRDWDVYRNHRIGFIFQSYNLIPHQTVLGNVELALTIAGMSKKERIEKAKAALDKVGLSDQYYKRPNQLSGGQSQRVAIARALVNDPEILLADEPTGALDTKTSVQIMDLVQEIAKDRLVIMVTHNPDLAEKYSTRIIELLDGKLTNDTNPLSDAEKAREDADEQLAAAAALTSAKKPRKKEKAKMSFFTAFKLSLQNLFTKKRRTFMTSFAGSIGIIGVSLVLSVSYGVQSYIDNMQNDMLSGNPITISESALDITALMQTGDVSASDLEWQDGKINVDSTMASLVKRSENMNNIMQTNEITPEYIDYVRSLPSDLVSAIMLGYGLNLSNNLYTDFTPANAAPTALDPGNAAPEVMSLTAIKAIYESILKETKDYAQYASFIGNLEDPFRQLPSEQDYILGNSEKRIEGQYNLVHGDGFTSRYATGENEVMLVLRKDSDQGFHYLSDLLLAQLGFYTQNEFMNTVFKAISAEPDSPFRFEPSLDVKNFSYKDIFDKEFVYYPNSTAFKATDTPFTSTQTTLNDESVFHHRALESEFSASEKADDQRIVLKVVGILEPKDDLSYGTLSAGFFYTEALRDRIFAFEETERSDIVEYLVTNGTISSQYLKDQQVSGQTEKRDILRGVSFQYSYFYPYEGNLAKKTSFSSVGASNPFLGLASDFGGMAASSVTGFGDAGLDMIMSGLSAKTLTLRDLSGRQLQRATLATDAVLKRIPTAKQEDAKTQATLLADVDLAQTALTDANKAASEAQSKLLEVFSATEPPLGFPDLQTYMMYCIGQFAAAQQNVAAKNADLTAKWNIISENFTYTFRDNRHTFDAKITCDTQGEQSVTLVFDRSGGLVSAKTEASGDAADVYIAVAVLYLDAASASAHSTLTTTPIISSNTMANAISIYPTSFETKAAVLTWLDRWNEAGEFTYENYDGVTVTVLDNRAEIAYQDLLSLIIAMIRMFIDIITIALICFTSLALVVSTVMIAIITYVSVVERIKEIGVIRSLGGRKRDVSALFNAETFIIGLVSGVLGIAVTYLGSWLINFFINLFNPAIGVIAIFPWFFAVLMVGISVLLSLISGIFPSMSAAKKDPVVALRTE